MNKDSPLLRVNTPFQCVWIFYLLWIQICIPEGPASKVGQLAAWIKLERREVTTTIERKILDRPNCLGNDYALNITLPETGASYALQL